MPAGLLKHLNFIPDVGFFSIETALEIFIGKGINSSTLASQLGTSAFDMKHELFV